MNTNMILQVLIQSSRLYEGQETLVLSETNANSLNLGSAAEQGVFTGHSLFYHKIVDPPVSRNGS